MPRRSAARAASKPTTKLVLKAKKAGPSHIGLTAKAIHEARDPRLGSARSRHRSAGVPVPELTRSVCIKLNKQVWL